MAQLGIANIFLLRILERDFKKHKAEFSSYFYLSTFDFFHFFFKYLFII